MARRGYTLFELMLVMALLVLAATLTLPLIEPMLGQNRLVASRDLVRARWAEMRARAMEEGRAYRFAVTENTGRFRIAPDEEAYWSGSGGQEGEERPLILEGELPEGVLFATSDAAIVDENNVPSPGADWGLVVAIYRGDGTARDDAEIWFGKAGAMPLGLRLRGLTGAVSAIERPPAGEATP